MTTQLAKIAALMLCQDCLHVRPYCESGHFGDYRCDCGGDFCGCTSCNDFAHGQGADFEKRQALEPTNEKPEPVRSATPRRELRLLCVLVKPHLDTAQGAYLPIHTMHRLPPRAMVKGQWAEPRYAGLYLRQAQARQPSAEVLERCLQQRYISANGRISVLRVSVPEECAPSDPANAADAEQVKGRAPGSSERAPSFRRTEARA